MSRFLSEKLQGLAPYTPGEQPRGGPLVKLNTNECPYPPSPRVVKAVTAAAGNLQRYADPECTALRAALAAQMGLAVEQVQVGNGSDELLAFAFWAFGQPGVAFADITYGFYPVYADVFGLDAKIIPLRQDFSLAPEDYQGLGRTIFIANPNAPSGLALGLGEIEAILQTNPGNLVILDEAYVHFGAESATALLDKYDNLLVIGTFSKSRQLAGGRLGYAVGCKALIEDITRLKFSFNPYSVNAMTLAAGIASIEDDAYYEDCRRKVMATRAATLARLRERGFEATESMGNFAFARLPGRPGRELLDALRQRGVLVRWFGAPRTEDYLRISIGTDAEMDTLFRALDDIL